MELGVSKEMRFWFFIIVLVFVGLFLGLKNNECEPQKIIVELQTAMPPVEIE